MRVTGDELEIIGYSLKAAVANAKTRKQRAYAEEALEILDRMAYALMMPDEVLHFEYTTCLMRDNRISDIREV